MLTARAARARPAPAAPDLADVLNNWARFSEVSVACTSLASRYSVKIGWYSVSKLKTMNRQTHTFTKLS